MSEEKRIPYSIYLTPRASKILENFSKASGYGSNSRTVEEIIIAFHSVYQGTHTVDIKTIFRQIPQTDKLLFLSFLSATDRLAWPEGLGFDVRSFYKPIKSDEMPVK